MGTGTVSAMEDTQTREKRATGAVVLSMCCAGTNIVAGRVLAGSVDVFAVGVLSLSVALAVILPFQLQRLGELQRLSIRDLGDMGVQALSGIVVYRVLMLIGLGMTTAVDAAVILCATPAATAVAARLILGEQLRGRRLLAVLLSVAAMLAVNVFGSTEEAASPIPNRVVGNLLVLGAVVSESLMTVFRKRSGYRVSHVTNTTVLIVLSLLFFVVASRGGRGVTIRELAGRDVAALLSFGVLGTAVGYMLWGWGAVRVPAATTGAAMAAIPITATLLGAVLLNEPVYLRHGIAIALAISGIVVASRTPSSRVGTAPPADGRGIEAVCPSVDTDGH